MNQTARRARVTRKKRKKTSPIVYILILLLFFGIIGGFYYMAVRYYTGRFPNHTTVNGFDVSNMTAENAKRVLNGQLQNYTLTIRERDGVEELITARQIDLVCEDTGEVEKLIDQFDPYWWVRDYFETHELTMAVKGTYSDYKAEQQINSLNCLDFTRYVKPEDARLTELNGVFSIKEEVQGNQPDEEKTKQVIRAALESGAESVDLEAEDCYLKPTILSDDETLTKELDKVQKWTSAVITYDFEDGRLEVADGSVIADWIVRNDKGSYELDESKALDWVKTNLAYKYDTFGLTHKVKTHSGKTVTLKGGDYGWCIARQDTTDALVKAVKKGKVETLEPAYQYKAKNRGKDDIGGTYVEVSIEEQMMWCYQDYELKVETPVVTGNVSRGFDTPSGSVWAMDCHKSPATLGSFVTMGYSSYVNYWMSFTGNVGIHDASWRGTDPANYGGEIYKTNGSHGCVNTPYDAARQIYKICNVGTPVIVY